MAINIYVSKSFWESLPSELTIRLNGDVLPRDEPKADTKEKEDKKEGKKEGNFANEFKDIIDMLCNVDKEYSSNDEFAKAFLSLIGPCVSQVRCASFKSNPPNSG